MPRSIVGALVAMLLVSCQAAPPQSGASAAPTAAAPTASPAPKVLSVIQTTELDTMDSMITTKPEAFSILSNIQEGLVGRDPKTMASTPLLAQSYSQLDQVTWEFKLRSGVTFHNGEPFNADAVKFAFDRIVKPELKSNAGATLATVVDKVDVVDPMTVRVKTKTPAPWLLERLARVWMFPPKETAEKGNDYVGRNPVGTGPYKFVEWKTGYGVTLERNDKYWGTKPAYDRVILRQVLETSTAISEILAGTADIVEQVPPDQIGAITGSGKADIVSTPTTTIVEGAFDALGRGGPTPFTDVRVRQAVNYAVDRATIGKALFGPYSKPVNSFLSELEFGYDPNAKAYAYDPAKAKQLLSEAGYPNGFETNFTIFPISGGVSASDLAQAILNDLGKVGIRAKIQQITANEASPAINSGKIGPIWLRPSTCGAAFDAHICFSFFLKGATNANWNSDQLEDVRIKAGASTDPNERKQLYARAQQIVMEQAPILFGWSGFYLSAVSKKVDWAPNADVLTRVYLAKPKQ